MAPRGDLSGGTPFVLTLELDGESFALFDGLRQRFYPPERNLVPAHVTMFHQLPGERGREVRALLAAAAAAQKPFGLAVGDTKPIGSGLAVFIEAPQLHALRAALAREWEPWLSDQDRLGFRPHVTVAADIGPAEARRLAAEIQPAVVRRNVRGAGLHLWRYAGGPWRHDRLFPFR